jgi:hypothetical protein
MPEQSPADWYPDPLGRHDRRSWDSSQWTHHVASRGRQEVDPPVDGAPVPTGNDVGRDVQRQARRSGIADGAQIGQVALFTEPVLVVSQKAKLLGSNVEYAVQEQHGQQIGAV